MQGANQSGMCAELEPVSGTAGKICCWGGYCRLGAGIYSTGGARPMLA
jgi:hypothetical protein